VTRRERRVLGVGATAMAAGTLFPWATAQTRSGTVVASGFHYGADVVLVLAVVILALLWFRLDVPAAVASVLAAVWLAWVLYGLPGSLTSSLPAGQAELTWAAELTALGALIALVAAGNAALRGVEKLVLMAAVRRA
jgi:hypothetical protein